MTVYRPLLRDSIRHSRFVDMFENEILSQSSVQLYRRVTQCVLRIEYMNLEMWYVGSIASPVAVPVGVAPRGVRDLPFAIGTFANTLHNSLLGSWILHFDPRAALGYDTTLYSCTPLVPRRRQRRASGESRRALPSPVTVSRSRPYSRNTDAGPATRAGDGISLHPGKPYQCASRNALCPLSMSCPIPLSDAVPSLNPHTPSRSSCARPT